MQDYTYNISIKIKVQMEITDIHEGENVNQKAILTLAKERQFITPEDPSDWMNSDQSQSSEDTVEANPVQEPELEIAQPNEEKKPNEKEIEEKHQTQQQIVANQKMPNKVPKQKIQQKESISVPHVLDSKFAILLRKMVKAKLVNLSEVTGLKGIGRVDLYSRGSKVTITTTSKELADQAISQFSDFIDDLQILKLDIRAELAHKLQGCRKVREQYKKRKVLMFGFENQNRRQIYIGGLIKMADLRKIHSQMKNLRLLNFTLRQFKNKRTYKLIIDAIFGTELVMQQMMAYNKVNMIEVDRRSKEQNLKYFMNTLSKVDIPPSEYEDVISKIVKRFFVVTFIMQGQKYYEKLGIVGHPEIIFKIIRERKVKVNISYLLIICQRDTFFKERKLIELQLQKLGDFIIGARFFNFIEPSFRNFKLDDSIYRIRKFPPVNTYSMCVYGKVDEGKKFYWREVYNMLLKLEDEKIMKEDEDEMIEND